MATAVQGKKLIFLYRILSEQSTADGTRLAFVTDDGLSRTKDADSTATKDGVIRTPSAMEIEKTATAILIKGDTMIGKLKKAMEDDELIEIWEANLEEPGTVDGTFKGTYFQGYLTDMDVTANAEDMVEVSLTFGINGKGADGEVTVPDDQQEDAGYTFIDTPAVIVSA